MLSTILEATAMGLACIGTIAMITITAHNNANIGMLGLLMLIAAYVPLIFSDRD